MTKPLALLEKYWGHTSFRPLQAEIIDAVILQKDTLALLPTGGGKSVCFQIPALVMDGICIVISPLVALIQDQVTNLKANGIKAIALTGGLKTEEIGALLDNCVFGDYKFLYLSPERLQQEIIQERIKQMNVNLIAVDEAHCISQWGNDFRPAYRNINTLRELLPNVPCIALTATATPKVVVDIEENLHLKDVQNFQQSFSRENLAYTVLETENKVLTIEKTLRKYPQSCIVYARNRKSTVTIHEALQRKGFTSMYFHGGLSSEDKKKSLQKWLNGKVQTIVATNAFGMGIDKPDVKNVIHIQLPDSLESYYQEAGRAGRDGEYANAIILTDQNDIKQLQQQFIHNLPDVDFLKLVFRKLCSFFQIAYGEGYETKHALAFYDFCKAYKFPTQKTYTALQLLDRHSVIQLSQSFHRKTTIQFVIDQYNLLNYLDNHPHLSLITQAILRTYGGVFEQKIKINTTFLAQKLGLPKEKINETVQQLAKDEVILLEELQTDAEITFLVAREDDKTINPIARDVRHQNELKKKRVQSVIKYIENTETCKNTQLLSYFGETAKTPCGICSVCKAKKTATPDNELQMLIHDDILKVLKTNPMTSTEICAVLPYREHLILAIIQLLLEAEKIKLTETNMYTL
ncbi:RecQ family ATP-dependent DNA helicase [Kordia sp. YSTF-M3]|uniref:ATP-dependent DNA helicase RecQ n=1 Tax=Kordia aestuariivivens TaxID=2759037 RepID=A0ABR7Q653_9FLAO|nr:ATP-dependent DNA helicase RecQ [Kordia aestuariivivens]MBC8753997.1 RecQ family ATP-dependent DNA helicase [Kordia aestuariivivens]